MQREGAQVIASSKEYPGAIPDLLTVSGDLIKERPDDVQKIVKTWWDVREFMAKNPEKSEAIMAKRAGIPTEEYEQYKDGTRFFSIEENLEAFSAGEGMKFMPFAAESMADFMVSVGFIPEKPDMTKLFDDSFTRRSPPPDDCHGRRCQQGEKHWTSLLIHPWCYAIQGRAWRPAGGITAGAPPALDRHRLPRTGG